MLSSPRLRSAAASLLLAVAITVVVAPSSSLWATVSAWGPVDPSPVTQTDAPAAPGEGWDADVGSTAASSVDPGEGSSANEAVHRPTRQVHGPWTWLAVLTVLCGLFAPLGRWVPSVLPVPRPRRVASRGVGFERAPPQLL